MAHKQGRKYHSIVFNCIKSVLALSLWVIQASASPTSLTYQGRIIKSDGTPLEYNNVSFIFQITDPSGSCVIYQEQVTGYNMVNSGGLFDMAIGKGTVQYPLNGTTTILDVFNNTTSFTCGSCSYANGNYNCVNGSTPYNATISDNRRLRVSFYDGSGWKTITPDNVVRSVPFAGYALAAQKLGDKVAADFLTKAGLPTCNSGTFLTWNGTSLSCAAVSGASGGTVTEVTSTNSYLSVSAGTSTPTLTVNVGTAAGTLAAGDDPRFSSAIQTGDTAGGTLSGTYPNPSLANNSVNTANIVDSAITTAKLFANPGINRLVSTDATNGTTLTAVTCAANQLLSWSVTLGWQCTNQSSLAVGSASLAANFTGSLSGDVTGTQSATIVSKIGGYAVDLSVAPNSNQVLTWNGSNWIAADLPAGNSGTVTSVTSPNADISVITTTTTPVLTLNSGVSGGVGDANKIAKLSASGLLAANMIPSLDTAKITTGTLSVARGGTGQSSYLDGELLIGNTVGNTLTKATLTAGSGISITNGNGSITIANTGLNGASTFSGDVSGTSSTTSVDKIKGKAVSTTAPTSGQFLVYDGTSQYAPVSMTGDATMSNTGAVTLKNTGTAGTYYKVTTDAQGRITSGAALVSGDITTALGHTPLNKAGDVMSGTLGIYATPSDPAGLLAGDKGKIWFNTTSNQLKYWDGSAAQSLGVAGSGLTSLNDQNGSSQTFAIGSSGTAPNWSSATNTHTLNIPMANTATVTAGLISKTEYDTFNNKLGTGTAFSGDVIGNYNSTSVDKIQGVAISTVAYSSGQVLRYDGTNWVNAAINAATDMSGIVSVANGGTGASSLGSGNLLVGNGTGAVSSLAAGSAGNVVYATGVASWSSGSPDTAGLVDKSSTQTLSGAKAFSNYIQMNAQNAVRLADSDSTNYVALRSPATVASDVIWTLPAADGTIGQILKTDGAGNLSWVTDTVGSGTVTSVTAANTDINVTTTTTTPVLTLNSGVAGGAGDADKIAKLNASGLLAVNMIPSLDAAKITTGILRVARGGTGQSTYNDGELLIGNSLGNSLTKATLTAGTGISITNGNGSITIANTGLTGSSAFSGDVSGTSSTTSVDKIKGKTVSPAVYALGQVLRYDGTSWVNAIINAATDLTGTLAIANGGTGATTAAAARTNLELGTVATLNTGSAAGNIPVLGTGGLVANKMCTADGTASGIICSSTVPVSSQWVTTAPDIYYNTGSVGIGTSTPQVSLDIGNPVGTYPTLTGPQANLFSNLAASPDNNHKNILGLWDTQASAANAGGGLAFGSRDSSGANQIGALIKTLRVSTAADYNHHLAFYTRNSGIVGERLRITDTGSVGIGTAAPSYTLHVVGTAGLSTGTSWTNASDRRLKDIHGNYEYGLNEILKLRTVRYHYKKNNPLDLPSDIAMTGFIAQEVQKVIPDAVKVREDGYLELNVDPIHWATVNAVQDLHQLCEMSQNQVISIEDRLRTHDREIASLKEENAKIKSENTMIKQALCELGKKNFCDQN